MVIPKIDDNLTRSNTLVIPNKCPCCGSETIVKDTDNSQVLMCPNQNCSAKKVAQFVHFVSRKCMNIENLSEATLEKLISLGYINDFKGIYGLSKFYDQLIEVDGLGPKSVEKLLLAIEKSRNVRLENFIAALGIPNIGLSAAKTIATKFNHSFDDWMDAYSHGFPWDKLDDFGETMANNLDDYLDWNYKSVVLLADEMNFILPEKHSNNSLEGLKFCITGSFSQPRDVLKNQLEARGAKFISSVSKNLDVLFAGDKAGSKLTKAKALGVKVADEAELMKILSN
jgi:DNA ligase (NAD+)